MPTLSGPECWQIYWQIASYEAREFPSVTRSTLPLLSFVKEGETELVPMEFRSFPGKAGEAKREDKFDLEIGWNYALNGETVTIKMSRPWTDAEIQLLGTKPDAEVGRLIGRPGKAVWAKRHALGIADPPSLVRLWTEDEDKVVLSHPVAEAARLLKRTIVAVRIRRSKLLRKLGPEKPQPLLTLEEAKLRIEVPKYDSKEEEEKFRLVDGPYAPPLLAIGGWLKCELRGELQVGGYTNALIPWPVAVGHAKQRIVCGDLVRALKTESRLAVSFHFGISLGLVSEYRHRLGIERYTAGSMRLFWRNIELARTPEARAKLSRHHEGRGDTMTPAARAKLREIQKRPKPEAWKQTMGERWRRRLAVSGRPVTWTEEELKMIGTRPDREVAKLLNRSLSSLKGKKFQLRRQKRTQG